MKRLFLVCLLCLSIGAGADDATQEYYLANIMLKTNSIESSMSPIRGSLIQLVSSNAYLASIYNTVLAVNTAIQAMQTDISRLGAIEDNTAGINSNILDLKDQGAQMLGQNAVIVASLGDIYALLEEKLGTGAGGGGGDNTAVVNKLDELKDVVVSMKDLLSAIKDKVCEEQQGSGSLQNVSLNTFQFEELPEHSQENSFTPNLSFINNALRQRGGGDPVVLKLPLSALNVTTSVGGVSLQDININFCEEPLNSIRVLFRGAISAVLYLAGVFYFIKIIRTFEY